VPPDIPLSTKAKAKHRVVSNKNIFNAIREINS